MDNNFRMNRRFPAGASMGGGDAMGLSSPGGFEQMWDESRRSGLFADAPVTWFEPICAVFGTAFGVREFEWDPEYDQPMLDEFRQAQERRKQIVAKNQAVIWSIGPDFIDDLGQQNLLDEYLQLERPYGGDLVFVVPPEPK